MYRTFLWNLAKTHREGLVAPAVILDQVWGDQGGEGALGAMLTLALQLASRRHRTACNSLAADAVVPAIGAEVQKWTAYASLLD